VIKDNNQKINLNKKEEDQHKQELNSLNKKRNHNSMIAQSNKLTTEDHNIISKGR